MKLAKTVRIASLALALTGASGLASAANYNYLEGGFLFRDNYGNDDAGFRIGGSVALAGPLAAFAARNPAVRATTARTDALFRTLGERLSVTPGPLPPGPVPPTAAIVGTT